MRYDTFIERVQARAGLSSQDEALRAIHATLETLGERLADPEREELAAELPKELRASLLRHRETQPFGLEEFYNRVSAREGVRRTHAVEHAQAVISVLYEAVSAGEMADVRLKLAPEYDPLFQPPS